MRICHKTGLTEAEINQQIEQDQYVPSCGECGTPGDYYDGLCYQCQAFMHSVGAYDMDGDGWRY